MCKNTSAASSPENTTRLSTHLVCSVAHLGLDLLRLDANLNVRCNLDKNQCIVDVNRSIYVWSKRIGLEDATMRDHNDVLRPQLRETEVPHNIPVDTDMFLHRLADNDNDVVFTLEDKDTSVLWSQFGAAYMSRWFKMLFEQSAGWRKSHLTIDAVVSKYRSFLKVFAPIFLKNGYPHFDAVYTSHACHRKEKMLVAASRNLPSLQPNIPDQYVKDLC